jgi:hypothetical protein
MNSYIVALEGVMAVQSVEASGYTLGNNGWWSFYDGNDVVASFPASRVVMILREDDGEPSDS